MLLESAHYKANPNEKPPADAQFVANGHAYEDSATVAQMNTYSDGIIVFQLDESQSLTATSEFTNQPIPNDTATVNPSHEPSPSQRRVPPAMYQSPSTQATLPTTSPMFEPDAVAGRHSQYATPTRPPSYTGSQYDRHSQQGAEYPHPTRPPYATPARSSEEILAQSQARARERSTSSRGTPSASGISSSQSSARNAIDQIRMDQSNRMALEKAKSKSREKSLGSHGTPAIINPESITPKASPVASEQAPPRSPSPVPDRPVTEFFEPTNSQNEEAEATAAFQGKNLIQQVINSDSLELLEDAVQIGRHILDSMEHELNGSNSKDATHWQAQIAKLKQQMTRTRTVVGVVGNTGAGKSR